MNDNMLDLIDTAQNISSVVNNSMPVLGMENTGAYNNSYHFDGVNSGIQDDSSLMDNITSVIACVGFLFFCFFCAKPNIPDARFHRGHEIRARALRYQALREIKEKFTKDPEERYKLIEYSLMKKKVIAVDAENGNLELGDIDNVDEEQQKQEVGSNASSNSEDEDNTCIICLDTFRVGDHVARSKCTPSECLHVFHAECIEEWLQANHDCPTCRTIILQESAQKKTESNEEESQEQQIGDDEDFLRRRHQHVGDNTDNDEDGNSQNSVFLIMRGLISRVTNTTGGNYSLVGRTINSVDENREEFRNNPNNDDSICRNV